ncbi:MAG TPA: protein kinase, partial [Polyangia bacterium]
PHVLSRPVVVRRFMAEARAAASVRHPGIVEMVDLDYDRGHPFLVMEKLEGEELRARMERGRLAPAVAARIAADIADAMDAVHTHEPPIVHRDLKPRNVFLAQRGAAEVVKILDFGIAKFSEAGPDGEGLTASGDFNGSLHYMAPEQIRSPRTVDHRVDVYAIGVILYQALSGRRPFEGDSVPELILKVCTNERPLLLSLVPDLPKGLAAIVEKAMAKDRDDRFASAGQLRDALTRFVAGESATSVSSPKPDNRGNSPRLPWRRWSRSLGAAVVAAALAAFGFLSARRLHTDTAPSAGVTVQTASLSQPKTPSTVPPAPSTVAEVAEVASPPPVQAAPLTPNLPRKDKAKVAPAHRDRFANTPKPAIVAPASVPATSLPPDATSQRTRAFRLRDVADYAAAVAAFEAAYAVEADPELIYEIAQTEELAGRHGEALKHLRRYLDLAPHGGRRTQANSKLAEARSRDSVDAQP